MNKSKIIFVHIPKTAGTSFTSILKQKFTSDKSFYISAGSITTARRYYEITFEIISKLDERIVKECDLLYGHMPAVFDERFNDFSYITFLREPLSRVISDYRYSKSSNVNPLFHIVRSLSITEYVSQNNDLHFDNLQTRLITGKTRGTLNKSDVDDAEKILNEKFTYCGITELFNYSLVELNEIFNWGIKEYSIRNVTNLSPSNFTDEEIRVVREFNKYDDLLYERIKTRFLERVNSNLDFFKKEVDKIKVKDINPRGPIGKILYKTKKYLA